MNSYKVLVIEDNEMNMKLVTILLDLAKFEVLQAYDAEQGLTMALANPPDLVLMDIQLPGMDGLCATRRLKQNPSLKDIPVVALTAHAMQGDRDKVFEAGCDGYIIKPINTRQFLDDVSAYLPTQKPDKHSDKTEQSAVPIKTGKYKPKILIVDDEIMNVKLMAAILIPHQFDITSAYNGKTALEITEQSKIDLILLDVMMPEMDGYEVTRLLKANPKTQHIPVILVTALNGSEDKLRGIQAGAEEFLTKPVNKIEILARISSMLRLQQYQEQLAVRTRSDEHFIPSFSQEYYSAVMPSRQRIMIVDDNTKDIKLIKEYIHLESYDYIIVNSGEEAIVKVQEEKIDLILLDIIMPGLDGYEVCKKLKSCDKTFNIQIILMTGLTDIESKLKGVEIGADDYLVKPVDSRELRSRINVLLKKKSYLDQLNYRYVKALNSAISDGLTVLYNQAYMKHYLELEITQSLLYERLVGLLILDLDDFKKYNDNLGHSTGDVILREVAQIIKSNIREIDVPARYGGEEFAVVFPYADVGYVFDTAERIRCAIQNHGPLRVMLSPFDEITASIGVAFCPTDANTLDDLIQKADDMLYFAKRNGKNRVCVYQNESDLPCVPVVTQTTASKGLVTLPSCSA